MSTPIDRNLAHAPAYTTERPRGRLRVALVTPEFGGVGGTTSVTRWLAGSLASDDRFEPFIVSVATSSRDAQSVRLTHPTSWLRGPVVAERQEGSVGITHVGAWWSELELQRYLPRRALSSVLQHADIVQIVAGSPAWGLLARRCTAPTVLQVATMSNWERASRDSSDSPGPTKTWRRLMSRVTAQLDIKGLKTVDKVMVENRRMLDFVLGIRSRDDVRLAPPGVDVDLFAPARGYDGDGPILTVGRLSDPRKNIAGLLEAYAKVRADRTRVPGLWLVGGVLNPRDRAAMSRLGIDDHVGVSPGLSQDDLVKAYQAASMFVLPSNEEGFGIAILEAMASGLPVVGTRCGGPEMIVKPEETGFLLEVGDVRGLADAMGRLIDDPSLGSRLGRNGRTVVVDHFSQSDRAQQFLNLYEAVAAQHQVRP